MTVSGWNMSKFRRTDNVCALNMLREHVRVSFRKVYLALCFFCSGGAVPRLAAVAAGDVLSIIVCLLQQLNNNY